MIHHRLFHLCSLTALPLVNSYIFNTILYTTSIDRSAVTEWGPVKDKIFKFDYCKFAAFYPPQKGVDNMKLVVNELSSIDNLVKLYKICF